MHTVSIKFLFKCTVTAEVTIDSNILKLIEQVSIDWVRFGEHLGIEPRLIEEIEHSHNLPKKCLYLFIRWLQKDVNTGIYCYVLLLNSMFIMYKL